MKAPQVALGRKKYPKNKLEKLRKQLIKAEEDLERLKRELDEAEQSPEGKILTKIFKNTLIPSTGGIR